MLCWIRCRQNCTGLGEEESPHCRRRTSWIQKPLILGGCEMGPSQGMSGTFGFPHPETLVWKGNYIFKGCRPCRRPRKNRQGSQANWHKNSSVLRTLRLSTFFLCILLWNIFDRFEFSFVNGFFMIYWLSWSRRSLCMSIQVRAMWSGG